MGSYLGRHSPVFLVLAFVALLAFGCLGQPSGAGPAEDDFGKKVEALNPRIAAAASASAVESLGSELAALHATAQNDSRYSAYLPLLDAQNLTLQVLAVYMEFKSEGAAIGTSGVDCSKNYSAFMANLKGANSTANSAVLKVRSYLSSSPNSTANLLITAINNSSPESMATYAEILGMEIGKNCLPANKPAKTYPLPLSGADALEIASGVAGYEYFVYGFDAPLPAGTAVTAPRASEDHTFMLEGDTWFFFLDSQPWAPFGHPVLYVMIDASTAEYTVANETMYLKSAARRTGWTWTPG